MAGFDACALAFPAPCGSAPAESSPPPGDRSFLGAIGHGIAQEVANQMASELGERVVVTCGLANADATPAQISEMQLSARAVMDAVSGQVRMARREA